MFKNVLLFCRDIYSEVEKLHLKVQYLKQLK